MSCDQSREILSLRQADITSEAAFHFDVARTCSQSRVTSVTSEAAFHFDVGLVFCMCCRHISLSQAKGLSQGQCGWHDDNCVAGMTASTKRLKSVKNFVRIGLPSLWSKVLKSSKTLQAAKPESRVLKALKDSEPCNLDI